MSSIDRQVLLHSLIYACSQFFKLRIIQMAFSRRIFLYLSSLSVLSIFSLNLGSKLKQLIISPDSKIITPPEVENPYKKDDKALVSIVGGKHVKSMIVEALDQLGGLDKLDGRNKTILVKPNAVTGDPHPTTTNPEVVGAVVEILYEAGAKKVIVGDMSALLTVSTTRNMKKNGMAHAAQDAGAEVVYFEDEDWIEVKLSGTNYIRSVYVSKWIYQADRVINLPVIKTHKYATYSICLKNFIGATHFKQRPYFIDESHWEEVVAEINQAYTPHLNIVDGTSAMIAGGPRKGTAVKTNIIIASGDRVAADIVGLGIIKQFGKWPEVVNEDIWEQKQIKRAVDLRLGVGKGQIGLKIKALKGHNSDFNNLVQQVKKYIEAG